MIMQKLSIDFEDTDADTDISLSPFDKDKIDLQQQSELGEVIDKAYQGSDVRNPDDNSSTIDFWSRIPGFNMPFINRFEAAGRMGVIPLRSLSVSRTVKRNFISAEGKSRDELVKIVSGKREVEADQSGFGAIKTWVKTRFGKGE